MADCDQGRAPPNDRQTYSERDAERDHQYGRQPQGIISEHHHREYDRQDVIEDVEAQGVRECLEAARIRERLLGQRADEIFGIEIVIALGQAVEGSLAEIIQAESLELDQIVQADAPQGLAQEPDAAKDREVQGDISHRYRLVGRQHIDDPGHHQGRDEEDHDCADGRQEKGHDRLTGICFVLAPVVAEDLAHRVFCDDEFVHMSLNARQCPPDISSSACRCGVF